MRDRTNSSTANLSRTVSATEPFFSVRCLELNRCDSPLQHASTGPPQSKRSTSSVPRESYGDDPLSLITSTNFPRAAPINFYSFPFSCPIDSVQTRRRSAPPKRTTSSTGINDEFLRRTPADAASSFNDIPNLGHGAP